MNNCFNVCMQNNAHTNVSRIQSAVNKVLLNESFGSCLHMKNYFSSYYVINVSAKLDYQNANTKIIIKCITSSTVGNHSKLTFANSNFLVSLA